jgi:hypothetical protein
VSHASATNTLGVSTRLRPPVRSRARRSPTAILGLLGVLPDPALQQMSSLETWDEVRSHRRRIGLETLDSSVESGSTARRYVEQLQEESGRAVPRNLKRLGELIGSEVEVTPLGDDVEVRRKGADRAVVVPGTVLDLEGRVLLEEPAGARTLVRDIAEGLQMDVDMWEGDLSQALATYGLGGAHALQVRERSRRMFDRYGLTDLIDIRSDRVRSQEQADELLRGYFLGSFAANMPDAHKARELLDKGDPRLREAWKHLECDPAFFALKANLVGFFLNGGGQCQLALAGVPDVAAVRTLRKQLEVFSINRDLTLLAAPGLHRHAQLDLLEYGAQHGIFSILDAGPDPLRELLALSDQERRLRFDEHGQGAWYGPWLKMRNPADTAASGTPRERFVPSVGHVAGAIGRTDAISGVHEPPANIDIIGMRGLSRVYSMADCTRLFRDFKTNLVGPYLGRDGDKLAGDATTSRGVERGMVSVSRVEGQIRRELRDFLMTRMFQRNSAIERQHLVNAISSHLDHYKERDALRGYEVEDLTDRECEDQGVVNLSISLDIVGSVRAFVVDLLPGRHGPEFRV